MNASLADSLPVPDTRYFHQQWWRSLIPCLFSLVVFGIYAFQHLAMGLVACVFSVLFCVLMHRGLIVSSQGIAWYLVRPQWRYRFIPWSAVHDVRRSPIAMRNCIQLMVRHDRYEIWIWGKPNPDRQMSIEIWIQGFTDGHAIEETIEHFHNTNCRETETRRRTG